MSLTAALVLLPLALVPLVVTWEPKILHVQLSSLSLSGHWYMAVHRAREETGGADGKL